MRILVWTYSSGRYAPAPQQPLGAYEFCDGTHTLVEYRPVFVDVEVAYNFGGDVLVVTPATKHRVGWGLSHDKDLWLLSTDRRTDKPCCSVPSAGDANARLILPVSKSEARREGFFPIQPDPLLDRGYRAWCLAATDRKRFLRCSGWLFLWSPDSHGFIPDDVRQAVLTVTMMRSLVPTCLWSAFPNELLFEVFYWLG